MAPYHYAYTFNAKEFHAQLEETIIRDGRVDYELFAENARTSFFTATAETKLILEIMGLDEDYYRDDDPLLFEEDADDTFREHLWYMICLAPVLRPIPSLAYNRFHGSHHVLRKILPLAGWRIKQIDHLIFGAHVMTLLKDENPIFKEEFKYLAVGGCLNLRQIRATHRHLQSSKAYFCAKSPLSVRTISKLMLAQYAGYNAKDPLDILDMAYADAIDMLQAALDRQEEMHIRFGC